MTDITTESVEAVTQIDIDNLYVWLDFDERFEQIKTVKAIIAERDALSARVAELNRTQKLGIDWRIKNQRHEIERLLARVDELQAARVKALNIKLGHFPELECAWQPIETAPKDGTWVDLLFDEKERVPDCFYAIMRTKELSGWQTVHEIHKNDDLTNPTHWQPLPTPPEKG